MSGTADIAAIITAETDGFTESILEAMEVAGDFFGYIVDAGRQAVALMGQGLVTIASDIATITRSIFQNVAIDIGTMAAKAAILAGSATAASSSVFGFWNTIRFGVSAASWFVPWLKAVSIGLTVDRPLPDWRDVP